MMLITKFLLYKSYFTLVLTPIVIAFEISHLNAPTSTQDLYNTSNKTNTNNNVNLNFSTITISDDLIYLETQKHPSFKENSDSVSEFKISEVLLPTRTVNPHQLPLDFENDDLIKVVNDQFGLNREGISGMDCSSEEEKQTKLNSRRIDLSDFIAIIPADQVKKIVQNYYQQDREIQRAYAYLKSNDFYDLKQKIINIPEVNDFLSFLNENGFNVLDLLNTLVKLVGDPEKLNAAVDGTEQKIINQYDQAMPNKVQTEEEKIKNSTTAMVGLHGLVDSILDILPQDQILSVFFDKLESDEDFSKLVMKVGSDEFSDILRNMENSIELRNLVYTLHNNGIYIARIVDSLKDYFLLGAF